MKYISQLVLLIIVSNIYSADIIGSRGVVGNIELPVGYAIELLPGKHNQDMLAIKHGGISLLVLYLDYDGLNPHQYILGDGVKINNITWVVGIKGDYSGIIDGTGRYLSFSLSEFDKNEIPITVSMLNTVRMN